MKTPRTTKAVSQIISEILLLAIAIISVSIIYTQVLGAPGPQDTANVTIIGKIEDGHPVFDLQRGESLERDTKIYINIAGGYNKSIYSLDQLFMQNFIGNQVWNIGEQIVLPSENLTGYGGPQVEGTIVDAKTNAIVFWGILQEGIITGHKGGTWHFDEDHWNLNISNEVKDSSGNKNHGIAKNNAIIINGTTQPSNVAHNNSGYFNVLKDAYVRVPSSWSLNISDAITVEAWMKPQLLPPILDIVDLEEKFGYTPYIIYVGGDCYAIVSEDQGKRGTLQTVFIDPEGGITNKSVEYFGNSQGSILLRPMITQMTDSMYLVSFNSKIGGNLYIHLRTYNISTDGSIEYTGYELVFQDYTSSANQPNRASLQKITDKLYAIAYWVPNYGGILKTLTISPTGEFDASSVKMIRYDPVAGYEPSLINVTQNVTALAYRDASNHGILKTFNISSTGDISYTGKTTPFDSSSGYEPSLIQVSGKVYAVAYRNTDNDGLVKTLNLSSNGSIAWTGNMLTFEDNVPCFDPSIIHAEDDFYVVAYSTGNSGSTTGYIMSLKLGKTGSILSQTESRREFKIDGRDRCYNPIILHIYEHLFAISFTGPTDHPGELITINIGTDTYPPHRGITKQDSYGIFANATTVVGSINNIMVSAPISSGWHHFAVTYDGVSIRLYVNGSLKGSTLYPHHQINMTPSDLLFGRNYHGYIDEIAIYDQALTQIQIQNHVNNRGTFEPFT
ncbi:MAG TPA: LamG domain-containing protein [Candidatus Thermoplasmatota archaeon]|nr:LamG domain-containing protein [Candidatus Thermoplasmatota archaeon]